jgi:hypothetical protein
VTNSFIEYISHDSYGSDLTFLELIEDNWELYPVEEYEDLEPVDSCTEAHVGCMFINAIDVCADFHDALNRDKKN